MSSSEELTRKFARRFVAMGDSFTEGVGDIDPSSPNDVRGWADRVAAQLISNDSSWGYANLAIRGKKLEQVIDEQLHAAIDLKPTLLTLYAGGNDIIRPTVDLERLMSRYRAAVQKLREETEARILLFTGFDSAKAPVFNMTRGRTAIYNEHVRKVAEDLGCEIVDFWNMKRMQDWAYWDVDRLHLGIAGHTLMAKEVLRVLGETDEIDDPELDAMPAVSLYDRTKDHLTWGRDHFYPWVKRRLTGASSGDGMSPKYPQLTDKVW